MALFKSIKAVLLKTRTLFVQGFNTLRGKTEFDEETETALETLLLKADFGIETTETLLKRVGQRVQKEKMEVLTALKLELTALLQPHHQSFVIDKTRPGSKLILMVGVNGAGKTTTIGKLAAFLKAQHLKVLLAAGDTYRAAAIQQLAILAERNALPLIHQSQGSDSASVIFDALQSALSKKLDVVIADTAGRLQNKQHLMEELKKIGRVLKKLDDTAPHEVILVLDASIGQNALLQLKEFNEAIPVTGLIITKLDGTAKGGIVFAMAAQYNIPIYFLGTGETMADLQVFDPVAFVEGLF